MQAAIKQRLPRVAAAPSREAAAPSREAAAPSREALSLDAISLVGRWQRAGRGHLAFAASCGCSFGPTIDLREMDEFILDFLANRFGGSAAAVALISACSAKPAPLSALLRELAAGRDGLDTAQARDLLGAIATSVASIEEQHA